MAMISVITWDAAPHVLAYRYNNCELTTKSQLVVKESQEAVLVKDGIFYGPIGPGRHTLETKNFPFISQFVSSVVSGGDSPYKAEVWFVQKAIPLDFKWGVGDDLLLEDPVYHIMLPIRVFGRYGLRVKDSCVFLAKLVGRIPVFTERTISEYLKGLITTRVKDAVATLMTESRCSLLHVGVKLDELSTLLTKNLSEELSLYGLELQLFMVNSISTNNEDSSVIKLKDALAKKAEMDIIGYSYAQERSFDALLAAAGNEGSAGAVMGAGLGLGMGVGIGAPMGNAASAIARGVENSVGKRCPRCEAFVQENAKFCSECGASLTRGSDNV